MFDVGKTYIFKAADPKAGAKRNEEPKKNDPCGEATPGVESHIESQWKGVFQGRPGWNTGQFSRSFKKSLGWLARLNLVSAGDDFREAAPIDPTQVVSPGSSPDPSELKRYPELKTAVDAAKRAIDSLSWLFPGTASVEAIFTPLGIAVLVVRGCTRESPDKVNQHLIARRERIRECFTPVVASAASLYLRRMESGAGTGNILSRHGKPILAEIEEVGRTKDTRKAFFTYPVFFVPSDGLIPESLKQKGTGPGPDVLLEPPRYGDVMVHVRWAEAVAATSKPGMRREIEENFLVAILSGMPST